MPDMAPVTVCVPDARAMEALGAKLARAVPGGCLIYLKGELGAGKTTLVRGLLRARGHRGPVKSPTYTLVEPYSLAGSMVYHLDLYRLGEPEELEGIGLRDLLAEPGALWLVEWPERGSGVLPPADLVLTLRYVERGREVGIEALGPRGHAALERLGGHI